MKNNKLFTMLFLGVFTLLTSCIKEEAPNAECDITAVSRAWLEAHREIIVGEPIITNKTVSFNTTKEITLDSLKKLDPVFELTPGASVEKLERIEENGESGIVMYYLTHSEDGLWKKDYEVSFTKPAQTSTEMKFSFENFTTKQFDTWHEIISGTQYNWWASSNEGFIMTGQGKTPKDFPTASDSDGVSGYCVRLKTCDTGSLGGSVGMPIAAGSIFIGEFQSENAMKKPLEATRFGLQIAPSKPLALQGYYKYTAGEVFTDKDKNVVEGIKDTCSIYAVLYEVDPNNFVTLCGSDVTTSDRIVLLAELYAGDAGEWTEFSIPFEPKNGKVFDYNKLMNNEYAFTVVASSSRNGGNFEGAIGSTLHIDELNVMWEESDSPSEDFGITAVNSEWLKDNSDIIIAKPVISNNLIKFSVTVDVDIHDLKMVDPQFDLTPGATIENLNITDIVSENEISFQYRVYSKDGKWNKDYIVSFKRKALIPVNKIFGFEDFLLDEEDKYFIWHEDIYSRSNSLWWATANEGFKMTGKGKSPADYPTAADNNGYIGNCVKLQTCDTGIIGKAAGMPIAAGNIFIGCYNSDIAMTSPLEAANFGLQILPAKPLALKGYYKYTAGEVYTDKNKNVVEGKKDCCSIYAVVYEVDATNVKPLNGEDIMTSDRIVLLANLENPAETSKWQQFNIPFELVNGKNFDYGKLANDEYAIAIVASSSKDGDLFEGAVGSTLFIDEFKLTWEE